MTPDQARARIREMHERFDYFDAAQCDEINRLIDRVNMATKVKGKVKADGGKQTFEAARKPPHFAAADAKKAARTVRRLKANVKARKA